MWVIRSALIAVTVGCRPTPPVPAPPSAPAVPVKRTATSAPLRPRATLAAGDTLPAASDLAPERRAIRIASEIAPAGFLKISVEDAGPGIPDAVFRRFRQPFISTKGQEGLGIGLSICRRIIEAHGGELEAHNLAGGAVVWFTVPLAPAAALAA